MEPMAQIGVLFLVVVFGSIMLMAVIEGFIHNKEKYESKKEKK